VGDVVSQLEVLAAIVANLVDALRHLTRSATTTLSQWRLSQLVAMAIRASTRPQGAPFGHAAVSLHEKSVATCMRERVRRALTLPLYLRMLATESIWTLMCPNLGGYIGNRVLFPSPATEYLYSTVNLYAHFALKKVSY
jgi:hypothetical protein